MSGEEFLTKSIRILLQTATVKLAAIYNLSKSIHAEHKVKQQILGVQSAMELQSDQKLSVEHRNMYLKLRSSCQQPANIIVQFPTFANNLFSSETNFSLFCFNRIEQRKLLGNKFSSLFQMIDEVRRSASINKLTLGGVGKEK